MAGAWIVGVGTTRFGRWPDRSHPELAAEAVGLACDDAGAPDLAALAGVWFGACALHAWGQRTVGGPVVLRGLVDAGRLPARVPVATVEAGCATGVLALHGAVREVQAGADLALAVGVDKTWLPDPAAIGPLFEGATDRLDPDATRAFYADEAAREGLPFAPDPRRSVLLDVAALEALLHQRRHGTTAAQLAAIAAKNRRHGADNPNALHAAAPTEAEVLADRLVVPPFTRAMCAPIADGAAAVLVASDRVAAGLGRGVRVRGLGLAGGARRPLGAPNETWAAAARAWEAGGVGPSEVDVAEVHDATAFAELAATEALGFCGVGDGGPYAASGATTRGGARPINPSGGLLSRGHPLAASGLAMVHEIVTQLRGEAGVRQVPGARVGVVHNAGGLVGFDEALCGVAVLSGS